MNKKILITAYDIDPYKGSESATGWKFPYYLAKYSKHTYTVITRKNNRANIERYFLKNPDNILINLNFEYYDLDKKYCFWKKGSRGSSIYYYLWQYFVVGKIKELGEFDIYHALNFHTDAFPSFIWRLKTQKNKIVWGPISHHEPIPYRFLSFFSFQELIKDKLRSFIKMIFWNLDPFLKLMQKNSDLILMGHSKVNNTLSTTQAKKVIINQVAESYDNISNIPTRDAEVFTFLFIGRLVPLKGIDIAIEAFLKFESAYPKKRKRKFKLQIIGKGPLKSYCEQQLTLSSNIELIDWVSKDEVINYLGASSVFLFPSHEGAGMVVAEAGLIGKPVVCINNYGPGEILDFDGANLLKSPDQESRDEIISNISVVMNELITNEQFYDDISIKTKDFFNRTYTWDAKAKSILALYDDLYD